MGISDQLGTEFHNLLSRNLGLAMLIGWAIAGVFLLRLIFRWKTCGGLKTCAWIAFGLTIAFGYIALEFYITRIYMMPVYDQRRMLNVQLQKRKLQEEFIASSKIELGQSVPLMQIKTNVNDKQEFPADDKATLFFFFDWRSNSVKGQLALLEKFWQVHRRRKDFDLVVIGVAFEFHEVATFMEENEFSLPFAADKSAEIYGQFSHSMVKSEDSLPPNLKQFLLKSANSALTKVFFVSENRELMFYSQRVDANVIKMLERHLESMDGPTVNRLLDLPSNRLALNTIFQFAIGSRIETFKPLLNRAPGL